MTSRGFKTLLVSIGLANLAFSTGGTSVNTGRTRGERLMTSVNMGRTVPVRRSHRVLVNLIISLVSISVHLVSICNYSDTRAGLDSSQGCLPSTRFSFTDAVSPKFLFFS